LLDIKCKTFPRITDVGRSFKKFTNVAEDVEVKTPVHILVMKESASPNKRRMFLMEKMSLSIIPVLCITLMIVKKHNANGTIPSGRRSKESKRVNE
jgi:hypothetical protein